MLENTKAQVKERPLKEILLLDLFNHLTPDAQNEIIEGIKKMLDDGRIKY